MYITLVADELKKEAPEFEVAPFHFARSMEGVKNHA